MEPRATFFGIASVGVMSLGAVLALTASALRAPESATGRTAHTAQSAETRADNAAAGRDAAGGPGGGEAAEPGAYAKGTELLAAYLWRDFAPGDSAWSALGGSVEVAAPLAVCVDAMPPSPAAVQPGGTECRRQDFLFDALVAILPDPYGSHLDWTYDASLESIRRAFEKAGYVADRFWIPEPGETVPVQRRGEVEMVARREVHPGVILFQHTDPGPARLRLLYIVGEMPTGGVHKAALENALRERHALLRGIRGDAVDTATALGDTLATPWNTVRVIGPTFSGSATSLLRVLSTWLSDHDPTASVRLVSGSATSFPQAGLDDPRIRFHATVNPDVRLDSLLRAGVLKPLAIDPHHVAVLKESSTVYGQSLAPQGDAGDFVEIPFSLNIASVRAAYERSPDERGQTDIMLGGRTASRLPLSMQDGRRQQRDNPLVTSRLTAPVLDLSLEEITRSLARHDVRAVGIQATDVRDKLFLGELVRRRMGDVQLFTFESSSLFLRTEYNPALRGMLVLSSYPLFLENQWWPQGGRDRPVNRIHFGSDGVQGIHNAVLIQLDRGELAVDYGAPFDTSAPVETRPPVWLTVVGSRSFLPIRVFASDQSLPYVAPVRATASWTEPPGKERHREGLIAVVSTLLLGAGLLMVSLVVQRYAKHDAATGLRLASEDRRDTADRRVADPGPVAAEHGSDGGARPTLAAVTDPIPSPLGAAAVAVPVSSLRWVPAGLRSSVARPFAPLLRRPIDAPAFGAYLAVERDSLLIHRALYAVLLLLALGGLFAPTALVVWHAEPELLRTAGARSVLTVLFGVAIAASWAVALWGAGARGAHHVRRSFARGREYAFGWQWWTQADGRLWHVEWSGRLGVAAFGAVYTVLTLRYLFDVHWLATGSDVPFDLFAHRALQIESGVSPLLPLILTAVGFAVWATWHLQRIHLLLNTTLFERICRTYLRDGGDHDTPSDPTSCNLTVRLAGDVATVRQRLFLVVPHAAGLVLLAVMAAMGLWLLGRFGNTIEALVMPAAIGSMTAFDAIFRLSVLATLAATVWAVFRLILTWVALRRCLVTVAETPLTSAFERLPSQISGLTRLSLVGGVNHGRRAGDKEPKSVATTSTALWHYLQRIFDAHEPELAKALADDPALERMRRLSQGPPSAQTREREHRLSELHAVLADLWKREPNSDDIRVLRDEIGKPDAADKLATVGTGRRVRRTFAGPEGMWLRVAEELAAVKFVDYVEWVLRHFRRLAIFLLLSLLITTVLLSSYPFQPQSLVKLIFLFVLLGTVGALAYVMVEMNRDEALSRITRTDPGRITWNTTFVLNVVLFAVLPLLALVSSEFSGLRSFLFAWLDPVLRQLTSM